jgi:hypothetical protein
MHTARTVGGRAPFPARVVSVVGRLASRINATAQIHLRGNAVTCAQTAHVSGIHWLERNPL